MPLNLNIEKLAALIKTVAKAAVPGAVAAIEAAELLADFVGDLKSDLKESDAAVLDAALPELLAAMRGAIDQAGRDLGAT